MYDYICNLYKYVLPYGVMRININSNSADSDMILWHKILKKCDISNH